MNKRIISKGSRFETLAGHMIVTGYNGHLVDVDVYEVDEDGDETKVEELRLTLNEIGHEMKAVDGRNHVVIWED